MTQKTVIVEFRERVRSGFLNIDRVQVRHSTPDGGMSNTVTREVMVRGDAAAVLIYDQAKDAVLLVKEFRVGNLAAGCSAEHCFSVGPVAGVIDDGENGLDCVLREAREEVGIVLEKKAVFGPLRHYSSPGGTSERLDIFVAAADISTADAAAIANDADEHTEAVVMSRADLNQMVFSGACPASLVSAVLLLDRVFPAPTDLPDVDTLSNIIRVADGANTLGAGALAEAIVAGLRKGGA